MAEAALTSEGRKAPGRAQRQLLIDVGCQKCFCVTFGKVTKPMRRIRRKIEQRREKMPIEKNDKCNDGKGFR